MKRALAFVYVLGVFLLGGVIGALAMHLYQAEQVTPGPPFAAPGAGHGPRYAPAEGSPMIGRMMRFLDGRYAFDMLELTPEQEAQLDEIRDDVRAEIDAVRRELRPRMQKHAEETRARIDAVLTEEQRKQLDDSLSRRGPPGHRRGRRPPPPPD